MCLHVSVSLQCRRWLAVDAFSLMLLLLRLSLVAWRVHQACTCAFRRTFFSFAGDCTPSLGLPSSLLPSVFPDVWLRAEDAEAYAFRMSAVIACFTW